MRGGKLRFPLCTPLLQRYALQQDLRRYAYQWLVPKGTSWYTATFGATLYRAPWGERSAAPLSMQVMLVAEVLQHACCFADQARLARQADQGVQATLAYRTKGEAQLPPSFPPPSLVRHDHDAWRTVHAS